MNLLSLILKSFRHYLKANLWVAVGVAISTAVLTGALIVGDSVKHSLEQAVELRLGKVSHAVVSGERFFTASLASALNDKGIEVSATLKLDAVASADGGQHKLNKINVWGIDSSFAKFCISDSFPAFEQGNSVFVSENLASRLNISPGDVFQLILKKGSLLPANAPFVSDENQSVSTRVTVSAILSELQLGRLNLQNSQTAPYNVFMPIGELNRLSEMENRSNVLLLHTSLSEKQLSLALAESWTLNDAGLSIREAAATDQWELRSGRVFMDKSIEKAIGNTGFEATPILTYFANSIGHKSKETPYSFVSTLSDSELTADEMVVNRWLADDIGVKVGDSVRMTYFEVGPLRELTEVSTSFRIKKVVEATGYYGDRKLMPDIPGLSDAENCRDWNTGVPVNLKSIRDKDEEYWYNYRGLPKAFISYSEAEKLWANRFGNTTAWRFSNAAISKEDLERALTDNLDPFSLDVQLRSVKSEGMDAAINGTDFSSLFLGLSFFILVAGLLLTALLFVYNIDRRMGEIGNYASLGFSNKTIQTLFLGEGLFVAFAGAIPGILLAVVYNELVFWGLNRVWNDIVRTEVLVSQYRIFTLIIGLVISVFVSMGTIWLVLRRAMKRSVVQLQRRQKTEAPHWVRLLKKYASHLFTGLGVALLIAQMVRPGNVDAGNFFMAGGALLIAFLLHADRFLSYKTKSQSRKISIPKLALQNLREGRSRSILVIALLSIGTFVVVSTGINRKDLFADAENPKGGTGGFLFWTESTVPLLHNLNNETYRKEQGFAEDFRVVQFQVADGDDASCLNLNRVANPRILGVGAAQLEGRFSVQTKIDTVDALNPWAALQMDFGNCVPAIADQTVIQWSFGLKVGDTLFYRNSAGDEVKLKLVAGLAASVFQGNVLIDNSQFQKYFPTYSGSNVFLIDGNLDNKQAIADELLLIYRDLGWEMTETAARLATFKSVENTYLSIFLVMGALGLLLGTIGLAVVLKRSLLSRQSEFALLLALGFSSHNTMRMVLTEYLLLLASGVMVGLVTALISVWPSVSGAIQSVSPGFVVLLIGLILVNGFIWVYAVTTFQMKGLRIVESLRNE